MKLFKSKGEFKGGFKTPSFDPYNRWGQKFGILGPKKDKHVILPGVTAFEEMKLRSIPKYVEKQTEKECTVPQHMFNDIYSLYVNENFKRKPTDNSNRIKQRVLDKVYNSLTKIVTKDSPLFSEILTRELGMYLQKIDDELKEEMEKNGQQPGDSAFDEDGDGEGDGQGQGQGQEEGDADGQPTDGQGQGKKPTKDSGGQGHGIPDSKLDDILNSSKNEKNLKDAMDKAEKSMKDLEEKLGKEALKDLMNENVEFLDKIDEIKDVLNRIAINKESIKNVLAKILDESQNYFSKKFHTVEESIFDTEQFDDLAGLEFLHPIFRNSEIESVINATRIYTGKIDLYLDCSGSMSSYGTFEGTSIRMADLVKGIAMVLYRMGMIDKLYFFDGSIYEIENINEFSILGFNRSGGTNFNKVVTKCIENGRNSVVITDGEDSCGMYASNVFWVGVGGTQFGGYGGEGKFKDYKLNKQCVTYNSSKNTFDYVTKTK